MMKLTGTVNAGYEITYDREGHFIGTRLAIGHNPKAPDPWVCWDWNERGGFSNGAYCQTEARAIKAMAERLDYDDVFEN